MNRRRRLARLEGALGAMDAPTWPEVWAAQDVIRESARARFRDALDAVKAGRSVPEPAPDPEREAAEAVMTRHYQARGITADMLHRDALEARERIVAGWRA